MLFFIIKTYRTLRRALSARRHPAQFAWAIAFGVLLGLIPHGNLLAVATLVLILCLRLNHPAMGLTAIGVTLVATKMDPWSDRVGDWILNQPAARDALTTAWQWPLVPWTDVNNTVVLGSFVIGTASLLPIFLATFPFFRWIAPKSETQSKTQSKTQSRHGDAPEATTRQDDAAEQTASTINDIDAGSNTRTVRVDPPTTVIRDRTATSPPPVSCPPVETAHPIDPIEFRELPPSQVATSQALPSASPTGSTVTTDKHHGGAIETDRRHVSDDPNTRTRIDIVRLAPAGPPSPHLNDPSAMTATSDVPSQPTGSGAADPQAMDEALNYLLHQLRDKTNHHRHGDAA